MVRHSGDAAITSAGSSLILTCTASASCPNPGPQIENGSRSEATSGADSVRGTPAAAAASISDTAEAPEAFASSICPVDGTVKYARPVSSVVTCPLPTSTFTPDASRPSAPSTASIAACPAIARAGKTIVTAHVVDDVDVLDDEDVEEFADAGACALALHPASTRTKRIAAAAQLTFLPILSMDLRDSNTPGSRIGGFRSMPPV